MDSELNKIQIQILTKFQVSNALHYSQAMPEGIDNDLFKYHIKFLCEKGFLQKNEKDYSLTEKGRIFCQGITPFGAKQEKFYVCIMNIVIKEIDGKKKVLIQERTKHPFLGNLAFITGKIIPGETIIKAAERKLLEETGLKAKFENVGLVRKIGYNKEGDLVQDQWYNVCLGNKIDGQFLEQSVWGKNYWIDIDDKLLINELREILDKIINNEKGFVIEKILHNVTI